MREKMSFVSDALNVVRLDSSISASLPDARVDGGYSKCQG